MNYLQKILDKENSCNPNRESMVLDYVLTMLGRGDSLDTINEVANLLRNFDNSDNQITETLLKEYGFKFNDRANEGTIEVEGFSITVGFGSLSELAYVMINNNEKNEDYQSIQVPNYLDTEKQLLNLIQTLFGVTLTKKTIKL